MTSKDNRAPFVYYFKFFCILSKPSVNSNWNYSPEMLDSGQNRRLFVPCDLEIWMTLKNNRTPLLCYFLQALCIISKPSVNSSWSYSPETLDSGQNRQLFFPCNLEIWRMTLKNNRAPLLCYFKLCASFQSHRSIQTGVTVRKRSIRVKIGDFLSRLTLEYDGWPWKTIEHLFFDSANFVHHFVAIGEFKLEL